MTEEAKEGWRKIYYQLSQSLPGLAGSLLDRGEAQVRRLAALYALLDCQGEVSNDHLLAALALWKYSVDSVKWIYGDSIGDAVADRIVEALQHGPMSDTAISALFGGNISASRLAQSKQLLRDQGKVTCTVEPTGRRPKNIWKTVRN